MMTGPETTGIVVLGVPRSGTTLVRRILNAHPDIASPGETCILSACARFLHSETVADGVDFGVLSGLSFAGTREEDVLQRLRTFATAFLAEFAVREGKRRWAEKTAVDIFHLERIEKLLGDTVRYICVVRHGLDVSCSLKEFSDKGFTYLAEIHDYVGRYPRPLEAFAHAWVAANQTMTAFLARHPDTTLLIRYEDLVGHPETVVDKMFAFLNEQSTDGILDRAMERSRNPGFGDWKTYRNRSIIDSSVQRWKSLPPNTLSRLAEICNPTLEAFGYDAVPVRETESQAIARRKYEFSAMLGKD